MNELVFVDLDGAVDALVARLDGAYEQDSEQHCHERRDEVVHHGVASETPGCFGRDRRHARYETVEQKAEKV